MITPNDFEKGTIIKINNEPWQIIEVKFLHLGRGGSLTQTKLKNIKSRKIKEQTFKGSEHFEELETGFKSVTFLYCDKKNAVFLTEDKKRLSVSLEKCQREIPYLKAKTEVKLMYLEDELIKINLPPKVDLRVIEAPPAIKGDTISSATKVITLETGLTVNAPLFIKENDIVRINTETGEYTERV